TTWTQRQVLTGVAYEEFALATAMSRDGANILIGAESAAVNGANSAGRVYRFTLNGTTWAPDDPLEGSPPVGGGLMGRAVAVSGDGRTVLAGGLEPMYVEVAYVFGLPALPAPAVTAVSPATDTAPGGHAVTVMGTGFRLGASVLFGGVPATDVTV